ncbi:MAG: YdjY domain-containing protein [Gemmataceae bacterium]
MALVSRLFLGFTVVLLIGSLGRAEDKKQPGIVVDKDRRTVTIDCKIAPRKMEDPKYQGVIYPIEVIACWSYPKGQKAHETVVTIDGIKPSDVHKAVEGLGLKPGKPAMGEGKADGLEVNLYLEIPGPQDKPKRVSIEKTLLDPKTNKNMPKVKWLFTGSVMSKPAPDKDEEVYGADLTGTLISVFPVTNQTVLQTNLTMKEEKFLKLETDKKLLPKEGTPVKLVIEVPVGK